MDRIVIIGNGFDLAHGLKTGYGHFLQYLKDSIVKWEGDTRKVYGKAVNGKPNTYHLKQGEGKFDPWICAKVDPLEHEVMLIPYPGKRSFYFESLFNDLKDKGWADLEAHYFRTIEAYMVNEGCVKIINMEFEHMKLLLQDYLVNEVEGKITEKSLVQIDQHPIYGVFADFRFTQDKLTGITNIVTFNYTNKVLDGYLKLLQNRYSDSFKEWPIFIHGRLQKKDRPIVFGYGDENSEAYHALEQELNNDLLSQFKTFQYLRNNSYQNVLGLLERSKEIYIQIIGHSCGLCDKALLKNIFEHPNVKYIESIYHENESRYFENLYNISRIFDDNGLMRTRVVPLIGTRHEDIYLAKGTRMI